MKTIRFELDTERNISNIINATGPEIADQLRKLEDDENFIILEGRFALIKKGNGRRSVSLMLEFKE